MPTATMKAKERFALAVKGIKPDKIPFFAGNYNAYLTYRYGITVRQYLEEPEHTAELMIDFCREFEFDQFMAAVGYILYGCGPEMGVRWSWPPDQNFPAAVEGPIQTAADVDRIQVPEAPTGYFKNLLTMARIVNQALGDNTYVAANLLGPFATSCFLRGVENVMLDSKLDLELFHKYMAKGMDISRYFAREIQKALSDPPQKPFFNEVFLTPELVSPKFYHEHISAYSSAIAAEVGVSNSLANSMGKPNDPESWRMGRLWFDYYYGTKESVELIEEVARTKPKGLPGMVAISGRALVQWPKQEMLDFIHRGVEAVMRAGMVPTISVISVQPNSPESMRDVADKLAAVRKFIDSYPL